MGRDSGRLRVRVGDRGMVRVGKGVPGVRRRTLHKVDIAAFRAGGAVNAKPAATWRRPILCAGRCVPFTMAAACDATVLSFRLDGC
jgi:hypothetical protein